MTKTKFEAMDILNKYDIPCGPILSMKEIAEEPSLRATGTVVEVDHPKRGKYLTVGNPIKMSDSPTEVTRSPLLGEHTDEVLAELGYGQRADRSAARGEGHLTLAPRRHPAQSQSTVRDRPWQTTRQKVRQILDASRRRAATSLTAPEGKLVCDAYGIAVPKEGVATSAAEAAKLAVGDGLPGRDEDRLAGHPAQDRSRRRARRREERRRGGEGLRHDHRQREEVQGRRQDRRRAGAADAQGRPGGDRRRRHRRQLRQAGRVRPRRRAGRGAEGHHLPPGAGDARTTRCRCSTASRRPRC